MDDVEQAGGPDRGGVGAVVDRELDPFRLVLRAPFHVLVDPLLLALRGGDAEADETVPDLELVHPACVDGGEVAPQGSQRDLLADDDEVRLARVHGPLSLTPGPLTGPRRHATSRR